MTIWALPDNVADVLPTEAAAMESMRRRALDLFAAHGYELVVPPLLEFVDSLLSGVGRDMDLATFKLVDQLSGKMMGVRADTTLQVARIDAHVLNRQGVSRLCYAGSVLHTRPASLGKSRQPFQIGAELYGHAGLEADLEVQQLMIDTLGVLGLNVDRFAIGHPAIFRALMRLGAVAVNDAEALFDAVVQKDVPLVKSLANTYPRVERALTALPLLYGGPEALERARTVLPSDPEIGAALSQLREVATTFTAQGLSVAIDLGELGGFNYESGMVFGAYARGAADAIARGGRYDGVGVAFGRSRPATGFSLDLKSLLSLVADAAPRSVVRAPYSDDQECSALIRSLRAAGEVVVVTLPGHPSGSEISPSEREIVQVDGRWRVVP